MKLRVFVVALCMILGLSSLSDFEALAQGQIPSPEITSISHGSLERNGVYPGQLVEVTGTGFATRDRQYSNANHPYEASVFAVIDDNVLGMRTVSVSSSKLTFVLPAGTPCGAHILKARNLNTVIGGSAVEGEGSAKFFVACGTARFDPTPIAPEIDDVVPDTAEPSTLVRIAGSNFLPPLTYEEQVFVLFRGEKHDAEFRATSEIRFLIPDDTPCSNNPYDIQVVNEIPRVTQNSIGQFFYTSPDADVESNTSSLSIPCDEAPPPPPINEDPAPPPADNPPPPPPGVIGNGDDLADYDADGNCVLSDGEFFGLIDAWIGESIDNLVFFGGVDAWIAQTPICASMAATSGVRVLQSRSGLEILSASSDPVGPIAIFNMQGQLIFESNGTSTRVQWNPYRDEGQPWANGVYLLHVASTDEIQKLLLMR